MSDDEIIFYSAEPDAEYLTETTVGEAVERVVDQWEVPIAPDATLEVTSYRRMALPSVDRIADNIVEWLEEWLDEQYAGPDGECPADIGESAREHAVAVAQAVRASYTPWVCEPVESWTVYVRDYVPAEWLDGEDSAAT